MTINHPLLKRRDRRGAFTLLEVLVVVAIILILASLATVAAMQILEDNKDDQARIKAQTLLKAAKVYAVKNNNNLPETIDLVAPYIEVNSDSPLLDPWGNPFGYQVIQNSFGTPTAIITWNNPKTGPQQEPKNIN